ncbi:MAG TPA: hypothetical protein DCM27_04155, partial [Rhodospirillaceae bacterium]|nr:hypothetical protein [Rhodospirillaceae bacterium]
YATYTSGTGTNALVFTLSPTIGDVDLDGVTVSSPIDLNGGTIKDTSGNDATLTFTPPNTSGIKVNYPSLGMDFTNGTAGRYTLNGTVYNDISSFLTASGGSFTRSSIGTYFDSTGILQTAPINTPRFDYDPVTHQPKGILIEESRTNLLKSSDNLLSYWSPNLSATVTYDDVIAPDGTMTADTISATASGAGKYQSIPITSGTTYTNSLFLKFVSGSSSSIRFGSDSNATTIKINPQTMNIISNSANVITSNINSVGGGWYRLAWSWSTPNTVTSFILYNDTASPIAFAVWGMQTEQGSFPTSYIPTTTTAITRAADTLTIPTASWITQGRGVLFSRAISPPLSSSKFPGAVAIDDGTINNALQHFIWDGQDDKTGNVIFLSGNTIYDQRGATMLSGGIFTQATAYAPHNAPDNMNASVNGTLLVPNMTTTVPTFNTMRVGARRGGGDPLNACIQQIRYYPLRISDAQLQILTQ